ncbi:MAG: transcription termination/antitermination protein NusA [Legionellales bacterium]|nr:transcription termination/antitermination protein NusA [Legionellales bacterium]
MSSKDILPLIESLANAKRISQQNVFEALESALAATTKKRFEEESVVRVEINRTTGKIVSFHCFTVIEDDLQPDAAQMRLSDARQMDAAAEVGAHIEEALGPIEFGRIDAQTAKGIIIQAMRDAERRQVVNQFKSKLYTIMTGIVKKVTREMVLLDLGDNVDAVLYREDMLPSDILRVNDRVRVFVYDVHYEPRGAQVFVSRTHNDMLVELFRLEVPEIGEEVIQIKAAARDPGIRAKIAVKTNDGRIDPIGACVGMRGSRVQAVSGELGGERIDIVLWDESPAQLVINAMAPAEVESIVVDEESHSIDVAVKQEHLSQAIGRNGQNVKLASELTGWNLNVMSLEDAQAKSVQETEVLSQLFVDELGVDEDFASILIEEGFSSIEEIAYVPVSELLSIEGFDEDLAHELRDRAQEVLKERQAETQQQPGHELLNIEGMTPELAAKLVEHGIMTMEDLAEQAVDDLLEIEGLDEETAAKLIMTAREPWFN